MIKFHTNLLYFLVPITIVFFGCQTDKNNETQNVPIVKLPVNPGTAAYTVSTNSTIIPTEDPSNLLAMLDAEYRLCPGDIIELYSIATKEIDRKYVIGPDGKITVPGVGVITLEGRTRAEASELISQKLSRDYLNPKVDVIVNEYNGNEIYVLGALLRTGVFKFKGRPTLLSAISMAEGFKDDADLRSCRVLRGRGTIINIDIYQLLAGDPTLNIRLLPGDTIFLKKNQENTFYLMGEVNNPGVFSLGDNMNIIRALGLGEGYTTDANLQTVTVVRNYLSDNPKEVEFDVKALMNGKQIDQDMTIYPGDLIYVPKRGLAKINYVLSSLSPALSWIVFYDTFN